MGDAEELHLSAPEKGLCVQRICPESWDARAMVLRIFYPYTSVPNRSTFGLLHLRAISSIVSLSASTLVLRLCEARKSIMAADFAAETRRFLSMDRELASV